jgi:hypothetical protein
MSDEILDAILCGRIPRDTWTSDGEQIAVGVALGVAEAYRDEMPLPILERERTAKRALKKDPDDPEANFTLVQVALERASAVYRKPRDQAGWLERRPVDADARRGKSAKKHEHILVSRLGLIWEWREGSKPVRTLVDGQPVDEFFDWAASIVEKAGFKNREGKLVPITPRWVEVRYNP